MNLQKSWKAQRNHSFKKKKKNTQGPTGNMCAVCKPNFWNEAPGQFQMRC